MNGSTVYIFQVAGSAPEPYPMAVEIGPDGAVRARCGCPAGARQRLCKHVIGILSGGALDVVGGAEQLPGLRARLGGIPLQTAVENLNAAMAALEAAEARLRDAKAALARTLTLR